MLKETFFATILLLCSGSAVGSNTITLAAFKVPGFVESSTSGEFIDLAKKLAKENKLNIEIKIYPPKRVIQLFSKGEVDGYFPGLDQLTSSPIWKSSTFYYKRDFLFTRKEKPFINIEGKRICLTHGYPYSKAVLSHPNVDYHYANSDQSCFGMLKKKRVEGLICEGFSGAEALEEGEFNDINIVDKPFNPQAVYFAFRHTTKGERLSRLFSKQIDKMRSSGELTELIKPASQKLVHFLKRSYDPTVK